MTCTRRALLWIGFAIVAGFTSAHAQDRDRLLVSPAWLSDHLRDPNLVLLHVGDAGAYGKAHIPGAQLVGLYDLSLRVNDGLRLEMLPVEQLHAKLVALGVSDASRLILYYDSLGGVTQATRLMFTLDRAGLGDRSALLDGGLAAWTRAGHPTTTEVAPPRTGQLSPLTIRPLVVDGDFVRSRSSTPGIKVVDGRATTFYSGEQTGGAADARHKTGHIAGAGSVPFTSVVGDGLEWKTPAELRAIFDQAGVTPGDTVIAYCHIGQQATAALFAARVLGHPVLLYDGSFEDWSRRADGPVETVKR
jgi:thiosulfate/3-mercaptopyruvate sulfurtransferase